MRTDALPDETTDFGRRVRERLRDERVIWLTTVGETAPPSPTRSGSFGTARTAFSYTTGLTLVGSPTSSNGHACR